jgi:hypothetical protein
MFRNREISHVHGEIISCYRKRLKMDAKKIIRSTGSLTMHAERLNGYKEINIVHIEIKMANDKVKKPTDKLTMCSERLRMPKWRFKMCTCTIQMCTGRLKMTT